MYILSYNVELRSSGNDLAYCNNGYVMVGICGNTYYYEQCRTDDGTTGITVVKCCRLKTGMLKVIFMDYEFGYDGEHLNI